MKKISRVLALVLSIILFSLVFVACAKKHTVSFNLNGGMGDIANQTIRSGEKAIRPPKAPTHQNEGLIFDDWYESADENAKKFNFDTPITKDTTLYAKYKQSSTQPVKYPINFILGEGGTGVENYDIEAGKYASMPTKTPTREGYEFTGWFADENFTTPFNFENTPINKATDIYAGWRRIGDTQGYNINFMLGGGTGLENTTVQPGSYVTRPQNNPVRSGYKFTGWYTDQTLENEFNFEETAINNDTTIYAGWKSEGKILLDALSKLAQGNFTATANLSLSKDGETSTYNNVIIKFNNGNEDLEISLVNENGDQYYLRDGYILLNQSQNSNFIKGFADSNQREFLLTRGAAKDNRPEPKGASIGPTERTYSTMVEAMYGNNCRLPIRRTDFKLNPKRNNFSIISTADKKGLDSGFGGMGGDTGIETGMHSTIDLNLPTPGGNANNRTINRTNKRNAENHDLFSLGISKAQEPVIYGKNRSAIRMFPYGGTGFGTKNINNIFNSIQNLNIDENFISKIFTVNTNENGMTYTLNLDFAPAINTLTDSIDNQRTGSEAIAEFINQINNTHNKILGEEEFTKEKINALFNNAENLRISDIYTQLNLDESIDKILALLVSPEDINAGMAAIQEYKNKSVSDFYTEIIGTNGKSFQEFIGGINTASFKELVGEEMASWLAGLDVKEFGIRLIIKLNQNDDISSISFNFDLNIAEIETNQETQQNINENRINQTMPLYRKNQDNYIITDDNMRSDRGVNQTNDLTTLEDIGGMNLPSGVVDGVGAPPSNIGKTTITEPAVMASLKIEETQKSPENELKKGKIKRLKNEQTLILSRGSQNPANDSIIEESLYKKQPQIKNDIMGNKGNKGKRRMPNEVETSLIYNEVYTKERMDSSRLDKPISRNDQKNLGMFNTNRNSGQNRMLNTAGDQTPNLNNIEYRIALTLDISDIGSTTIDYDTTARHNLESGLNFEIMSIDNDYNMPFETFGNNYDFSKENLSSFIVMGRRNDEEVRQFLMDNIRFENNSVRISKDALNRIRDYGVTGANFIIGGENPTPVNFRFDLNGNSETTEVAPFRGAMAS